MDDLKIHGAPISVLGGLAVVAGVLVGVLGSGYRVAGPVVAAVLLGLAVGLADDRWGLPAWLRAAFQAGAGLLLVVAGLRLEALGPLGAAGTVVAVLACTNAANMLDGQDALLSGLALIAALGLASIGAGVGGSAALPLALAFAGALAGFVVWNRPPAAIFLGNGGAYALGVLLATLASDTGGTGGWRGLLAAGACLGVFAFELLFTVARRMLARDRLATGDRYHTYDLLSLRIGRTTVTLFFWGLGILAAFLGLAVIRLPLWGGVAATAAAGAVAAAWAFREWTIARRSLRRAP